MPAAPGADLHHLFAELASQCQEIIYGIRQQNTLFQQILLAQGFRKGDPVFLAELMDHKEKLCIEIAAIDKGGIPGLDGRPVVGPK